MFYVRNFHLLTLISYCTRFPSDYSLQVCWGSNWGIVFFAIPIVCFLISLFPSLAIQIHPCFISLCIASSRFPRSRTCLISLLPEMGTILQAVYSVSDPLSPIGTPDDRGFTAVTSASDCHGMWYSALLVAPSVLFVIYLATSAIKNMKRFFVGRSFIMISYYALLWIATLLNLAWCSLQVSFLFFGLFSSCGGFQTSEVFFESMSSLAPTVRYYYYWE